MTCGALFGIVWKEQHTRKELERERKDRALKARRYFCTWWEYILETDESEQSEIFMPSEKNFR